MKNKMKFKIGEFSKLCQVTVKTLRHYEEIGLMIPVEVDGGSVFDFSVGGMYRDKKRDSFFNEYTFNSATGVKDPQYQGEDWNNYDEILFTPLKYGNISDPLNYDATEKIGAGYGMVKYTYRNCAGGIGWFGEYDDGQWHGE
jgi:hypothetical protein